MSLNLIRDSWIPVSTFSGPRTIRPDQIAESDVLFPDWPRADLNIACLELLIGLVALADPPASREDWRARRSPDAGRLRERLAPLAPAFDLDGAGPRFLQDLEALAGEVSSPDMLFIDSAGENAARKNADLMVRRDRYPALDPALAAMTLYTLQAWAPSGGAGNRTSMRGGGPLVTLVEPRPGCTLWDLVWANVPQGVPKGADVLPWMRPTRVSDTGHQVHDVGADAIEAFFGMPRRLRLVFEEGRVTGVIQRPYGTNYGLWRHPLTPYYRLKPPDPPLPVHPRAGLFGYRNWLGVVAQAEQDDLRNRAAVLDEYDERALEDEALQARVIVAGWAMDNMKPRDFILSRQPLVALPPEGLHRLEGMIDAARSLGAVLSQALKPVVGGGVAVEGLVEEFFLRTDAPFRDRLAQMKAGADVAPGWLGDMRRAGMAIFDAAAVPGLADRRIVKEKVGSRSETGAGAILAAREFLRASFAGYGKLGIAAFSALDLELPEKKTRKKARSAA